jgi:hypothetical protein
MGKVKCEISMSLDGFIAGPNVRVGNGMGDDGDPYCNHGDGTMLRPMDGSWWLWSPSRRRTLIRGAS